MVQYAAQHLLEILNSPSFAPESDDEDADESRDEVEDESEDVCR